MPPAPRTVPQRSYKQAVVLYYWTQCGHCRDFAPVFEQVVEQLPNTVKVYEIEVAQQQAKLEEYGVDIGAGVPRLEIYDKAGDMVLFEDARTLDAVLAAIREHLGLKGGGLKGGYTDEDDMSEELRYLLSLLRSKRVEEEEEEEEAGEEEEEEEAEEDDGDISALLAAPAAIRAPALTLYFMNGCGHCVAFKPTYKKLAALGTLPKDLMVCAVDVQQHNDALQSLQPQARSGGVPHVVMLSRSGYQTPFDKDRTMDALVDFIQSSIDATNLEGGGRRKLQFGEKPQKTTMRKLLSTALDELQDMAAAELARSTENCLSRTTQRCATWRGYRAASSRGRTACILY